MVTRQGKEFKNYQFNNNQIINGHIEYDSDGDSDMMDDQQQIDNSKQHIRSKRRTK